MIWKPSSSPVRFGGARGLPSAVGAGDRAEVIEQLVRIFFLVVVTPEQDRRPRDRPPILVLHEAAQCFAQIAA